MSKPPEVHEPLSVTVCNPYIPPSEYREEMVKALECIGQHLTKSEFEDLVLKKLRLEDSKPSEAQYLQAAVELTVCAHYARFFPEGFFYEDKVAPPRDVDCSFQNEGYKFNVEVKCADFTAKQKIDESGAFIMRAVGRMPDYNDAAAKLKETFASGGNELVKGLHMDNKLKAYLMDAHDKFPDPTRQDEYNVLVVGCDDQNDIMQWEGYLTGAHGLFTEQSYAPTDDYDNVDMVVLTNLYHRHKSVEKKDKLTGHWWFGESFSLLYQNPRSTKPQEMALAFAKTLRFYNNEITQHRMEGDAPDWLKKRLAIPHYVGDVLMRNGQYLFQPGKKGKSSPGSEAMQIEV
ncbi:hypothetical protein JOE33_000117 [Pseudomonas sp. PvP027]|jgi:hypothetical protein|uniref:hypothetical protein n=1 Tax=Pseudomonas sp. PvP027 TaxID=2806587 RepID=UPI0001E29A31|nr:hypothetical protein [Pseudomonas sp. PvP027]MBP1143194.1 hypothetical protein [Pseudomonas sp. PvP027]